MNRVEKHPLVISIAAVSGGGKTAVTTSLSQQLPNARALFFDDYDLEGPDNIPEWVENGANYNAWNLAPLASDLKALLSEPIRYIVLDFPFAYAHAQIGQFIDFAVFIDTPLDVALGRRLIRNFGDSTITEVMADIQNYLLRGRMAYLEALQTIKPHSDFIVDGTLPVPTITSLLLEQIKLIDPNA